MSENKKINQFQPFKKVNTLKDGHRKSLLLKGHVANYDFNASFLGGLPTVPLAS